MGVESLDADVVDGALGALVSALKLDPQWQREIVDGAGADMAPDTQVEARRAAIERKLAWNKRLLQDGDISQQDYCAERTRLEAALHEVAAAVPATRVD